MKSAATAALMLVAACADNPTAPEVDPTELYAGGEGTVFDDTNAAFSHPLPILDRDAQRTFFKGQALFRDDWVVAPSSTDSRDGLGPVFNARACSDCHVRDGRGEPPQDGAPMVSMFVRLSITGSDEHGAPLPDPIYGEQLQPYGVPGVLGEATPLISWETIGGSYADGESFELRRPVYDFVDPAYGAFDPDTRWSGRVARQLVGLALLEAIPEASLDALGARPNETWDVRALQIARGRIGWKATQPNVVQQAANAFHADLGLTTSVYPEAECSPVQTECVASPSGGTPELLDVLLDNVALYTAALAVPARRNMDDPAVQQGRQLFRAAGCVNCHVPKHVTGEHPLIAGLGGQTIWPYTDLALHDMGEGLADERPDHAASGSEWRTPPLWGVGLIDTVNGHIFLLHDGRARGFAEAVLWHDGEAAGARDAFVKFNTEERAALMSFLESL